MKAIYINLDPYLAAFAAWIKANPADPDTGERATPPPTFNPLPLAVTIPLGESAAIYKEAAVDSDDWAYVWSTVDGVSIGVKATSSSDPTPGEAGIIASDVVPGFSALTPSAKYGVFPVEGDTTVTVIFNVDDSDYDVTFTVLVRREQPSGPVDLVDFTPPADAIAAGTDLKGATFDGNEIVAAETTGALSAPAGA